MVNQFYRCSFAVFICACMNLGAQENTTNADGASLHINTPKASSVLADDLSSDVSRYLLNTARENGYRYESVDQIFKSYFSNFPFTDKKDAERWERFRRKVAFVKCTKEIPCKQSVLKTIANPFSGSNSDECRLVALKMLNDFPEIQNDEAIEAIKKGLKHCVDGFVRNEICVALTRYDQLEGDFIVSEILRNKEYSHSLKLDLLEKLVKYESFPVNYDLLCEFLLSIETYEKDSYDKVVFCIKNAPNKLPPEKMTAFWTKVSMLHKKIQNDIAKIQKDVESSQ